MVEMATKSKKSPMKRLPRLILYLFLFMLMIVQFYPVFWIVMTSFKTTGEQQLNSPFALPESLNTENYLRAFAQADLTTYYTNSIIVTVATIFAIVFFSVTASFAIEKLKFRYNKSAMSFFLLGISIPIHVTLIPLFMIYRNLGLINTYWSLIIPQVGFGLPISIYLFSAFFKYLPNSLLEASIIDGCSVWKSFLSVFVPLSKNTIMTVVTMNIIFVWNEFVFANTFVSRTSMKTLPVGINDFMGERGRVDWGATFSAIAVSLIPMLVLYFILNKNIIAGMTAGAIKE